MIVIGADTHEQSHTLAAVVAASGRMLAERLGAESQQLKSGVFRRDRCVAPSSSQVHLV